jgi:hypothetical protein
MSLTKSSSVKAFTLLNKKLLATGDKVSLIVGGGGSMMLAHEYDGETKDIDAVPIRASLSDIDALIKEVAAELHIPSDWLNPYFGTFMSLLPNDYDSRLTVVYSSSNLEVKAIGAEDLIIMKCFARRPKDRVHIQFLTRKSDKSIVEMGIESARGMRGDDDVDAAFDFLDECWVVD